MVSSLHNGKNIAKVSPDTPIELPSLGHSMEKSSTQAGVRRFNLRKRSINAGREVNMSSYNSAFLSGLFADVAKVNDCVDSGDEPSLCVRTLDEELEEARFESSSSVKRSRISMTKSISRIGRSYKNLTCLFDGPCILKVKDEAKPAMCSIDRLDSLHYQLNCVASVSSEDVSSSPKSVMSVLDVGKHAFPNLPTIRVPSFSHDLTQKVDRAVSASETPSKESYGWFVEMEDFQGQSNVIDPYNDEARDLAFSAATAPKRSQLDADLEWATAADTVDDVLGDFF